MGIYSEVKTMIRVTILQLVLLQIMAYASTLYIFRKGYTVIHIQVYINMHSYVIECKLKQHYSWLI